MFRVYVGDVSPLENGKLFESLYDTVSADRQKKIDALRFDRDRRLSLGAELLLKKAAEDTGYRYQTLQKSFSEKGKPFFENLSGFCFNLSHSGTMAMCAVSDRNIGCDVEKITGSNLKIAKRFFSGSEYEFVAGQRNEKDMGIAFARIWSLKESFIKATGLGLSLALNKFEIIIGSDGNISVRQDVSDEIYRFCEIPSDGVYMYSVCTLSDSVPEIIQVLF